MKTSSAMPILIVFLATMSSNLQLSGAQSQATCMIGLTTPFNDAKKLVQTVQHKLGFCCIAQPPNESSNATCLKLLSYKNATLVICRPLVPMPYCPLCPLVGIHAIWYRISVMLRGKCKGTTLSTSTLIKLLSSEFISRESESRNSIRMS